MLWAQILDLWETHLYPVWMLYVHECLSGINVYFSKLCLGRWYSFKAQGSGLSWWLVPSSHWEPRLTRSNSASSRPTLCPSPPLQVRGVESTESWFLNAIVGVIGVIWGCCVHLRWTCVRCNSSYLSSHHRRTNSVHLFESFLFLFFSLLMILLFSFPDTKQLDKSIIFKSIINFMDCLTPLTRSKESY